MQRVQTKALVVVAAAIVAAPGLAGACAMCGLSPGDTAGHAFNTSVLFMLAGPYVTVSIIAGLLYLSWRRFRRQTLLHAQAAIDETNAAPKGGTESEV